MICDTHHLLTALDLLNSYVRSESCRDHWSRMSLSRAVYVYKTEFIRVYVPRLTPDCYVVRTKVKCRDCGGTGRYYDSYGFTHDHCWACNSSGTATLTFVETHWPRTVGRIQVCAPTETTIWHTPVLKWPWFRNLDGYNTQQDMQHKCPWATNYQPNQKGRGAELSEVIDALATVERWYWESGETNPPRRDTVLHSDYGSYSSRSFVGYRLNIGYRHTCPICGRKQDADTCCHNCRAGGHPYLDWGEPVCKECYDENKETIWDILKLQMVPTELCNKDVMKFLRTHGEIVEKHGPRRESPHETVHADTSHS